MRRLLTVVGLVVCACANVVSAQGGFDAHFTDRTMRIDYYHTGDAASETVAIDRIYEYGLWAGSIVNLVDPLNYGAYSHKVYDAETGALIYSRGFDSYFKEYQSTSAAKDGTAQTFHESAIVPAPRAKVVFALDKRDKEGNLVEVFRREIDPENVMIIRDRGVDPAVKVVQSQKSGDPHVKADIAIIAEGYGAGDEAKFRADLERFTNVFFLEEPCKSSRDLFNVYGVFKPSAQSGISEPRHGSFRNSVVGATFNSMGSERYILTEDNRALRDIAGHAPYDALYIMINHHRYGGGGIYNFYCTFTADNQWSEYLMVHEFGHSFFGLADEYYTSSTAYEDFYPAGYEPAEPNITALLDKDNLKWKHLLTEGTDLPTPWEKTDYDEDSLTWQKERNRLNDRIAELRKSGAPDSEVEAAEDEYNRKDRAQAEKMHAYLEGSRFAGQVGAFEGAGYMTKGMYRPMANCIMFSKGTKKFCAVCADAMKGVIDWYAQ